MGNRIVIMAKKVFCFCDPGAYDLRSVSVKITKYIRNQNTDRAQDVRTGNSPDYS